MITLLKNYQITILLLGITTALSSFAPADNPTKLVEKEPAIKSVKILTLGDSNGALPYGWVTQLKKIRPDDSVYNISVSGNTIGFNNLGQRSLNTLVSIDRYMDRTYEYLGSIDEIVIMLGTNDCKAVFKDSLKFVPDNMRKLINRIRYHARLRQEDPSIYIVSPPPFGQDEILGEKYTGGLERVLWLNEQLHGIADKENVVFINSCQILLPVFKYLTEDGVHLNSEGQMMIALIIEENLKFLEK